MGVREAVEVRARTPGQAGYVVITVEFAGRERGLDGFDPARRSTVRVRPGPPRHARSEYVWNVLLGAHRGLVAGVVERSMLPSFCGLQPGERQSAIAAAAEGEAWLPGRDGAFRRPAELSLDDLPPTYTRDEALARR